MAVISKDSIIIELDIQGQAKVAEMEGQLSKLESKTNTTKGKFSDMSGSISKASDQIKNKITQAFPEAEGAINRVSGAIGGLKSSGEKGAGGIFTLGNALKLLGGGVIGIVIAAIGALTSYLSKLDPVVDRIQQLVGGASAAFFTFGQRVAELGGGLGDIFSGDVKAGIDRIKNSVLGLGDALSDSAKRGVSLVARLQEIQDFEEITSIRVAERETQIAGLRARFKKSELDDKEKLAKQIKTIDEQNLRDEKATLELKTNLLIDNLANQGVILTKAEKARLRALGESGGQLIQDLLNNEKRSKFDKKYYEDYLQLALKKEQVEKKSISTQEKFSEDLADIQRTRIEKQKKAQEEAAKAEAKRLEDIAKLRQQLVEDNINLLENEYEREEAILSNKFLNQFTQIKAVNTKTVEEEKLKNELLKTEEKLYLTDLDRLRAKYHEKRIKEAKELLTVELSGRRDPFQAQNEAAFKQAKKLADDFNKLRAEDALSFQDWESRKGKIREEAARATAENTIELYQNLSQARIDNIDAEINAQESKINRFKELAEFGTSEQLQLEEDRLARLQAARQKEVEKQRQLAAVQIAINQAVTISEGVKLAITAFGKGDILSGVLTTLAALSSVAILTQQISSSFGSLPAFKGGTDYVQGQGTETSDSILARLSKGERVVPAHENKELRSIGVISNQDLVRYAKIGRALGDRNDIQPQQGKDYTDALNNLVAENRLMRKKLENLEIHMGISSEGVYGLITSMSERSNKLQKLKD